jgi:hypothetical protein
VDGVQAVSQERFGQALIEGTETLVAAVDPACTRPHPALDYTAGGSDGLTGPGLLVTPRPRRPGDGTSGTPSSWCRPPADR